MGGHERKNVDTVDQILKFKNWVEIWNTLFIELLRIIKYLHSKLKGNL